MILAIDTSQMTYSIALSNGVYLEWTDNQITLLDQLSQYDISTIQHIVVNIGPGRFSGLRSGLAFAKGFAKAQGIDLIGINSFSLIASQVSDKQFSMILDARKDQFYKQDSDSTNIELISHTEPLDKKRLYGNIAPAKIITFNAQTLLDYYVKEKPKASSIVEPLYIRNSV